jgi:hypothetical protein
MFVKAQLNYLLTFNFKALKFVPLLDSISCLNIIYLSSFVYQFVYVFRSDQLVALDMNIYHVPKINVSVYLTYNKCDTISLVVNLDQTEQNIVWLSIFQLKVHLSCDNRSKQKCYCKSDDPPWRSQEYPKLCVYFSWALTSIGMSKKTLNYTYLSTPLPNFPICATMTPIGVIKIFSNSGILNSWSEWSACAALGCWHKRRWPL